jgi:nanoRNase/pAp phosphatase (c-di-AMP/oligoRNAs hydrolase)
MQIQAENYEFFANLISQAKSILILVRKNPDTDALAAALFLKNTLTALGKKIQIVAEGEIPSTFKHLSTELVTKIEPKKLVVSFNWHKNAVEKVSYNLDGENFNFIVSPREGSIEKNEVEISHKGDESDLIIALGIPALTNLDNNEREYLRGKEVINIDNSTNNQLFGKLNLVNDTSDSICGIVGKLIEDNQFNSTAEAADFLLVGLKSTTDNFNSVSDPTTFEVAAFCARIKKGMKLRKKDKEVTEKTQVPKEWLSPKIFRSKQAS